MVVGQRLARSSPAAWNAFSERPKCAGIAADLVQRDEAVVAVERGVLDALRHHRRGELLEAHGEAQHLRRRGPSGGAASSVSTPCTKSNTLGSAMRLARRAAFTAQSIQRRSVSDTPRGLT